MHHIEPVAKELFANRLPRSALRPTHHSGSDFHYVAMKISRGYREAFASGRANVSDDRLA